MEYVKIKECHIHIDIYFDFKKENKNYYIYNVNDDDENIIFLNYLFMECIKDYENLKTDTVRKIEPDDLIKRYLFMNTKIQLINSTIHYKIQKLIEFISKNYEHYIGIKIIY